mgnify:CR=1 FL=1|jgi:hypothetical protein
MKNLLISRLSKLLLFIIVLLPVTSFAQSQIPVGYFLFPIKPGQQNFLAGNMGELRPNHFHGGLDIKTEMRTGLPVYASADGYVSRLKVSSFGYGNTVYITHPNGLVTVYAHLDKFNKEIGDVVRQYQYENQQFEVDFNLPEGKLPVKKGEIIALSGNSGSSGGPHLHYEIRDVNENLLNPLDFKFAELKDNIAPVFSKIALVTTDAQSRVNQEFGRFEFNTVKVGTSYTVPTKITAWGTIGLQIKVHDQMNGTSNTYGVKFIRVYEDGKLLFDHDLSTFGFHENRYINVHMDYEAFLEKGAKFQKCYISDGDKLNSYNRNLGKGYLHLSDGQNHKIEVEIEDSYENISKLVFNIQSTEPVKGAIVPNTKAVYDYAVSENILKIRGKASANCSAKLYTSNKEELVLSPDYFKNGQAVYLYDLRKGLPDSVVLDRQTLHFNFVASVPPGQEKTIQQGNMTVKIPADAIFDTLYLQTRIDTSKGKESFILGHHSIPLFTAIDVAYETAHPDAINKSCSYVHLKNKLRGQQHEKGCWTENTLAFKTKSFGHFVIVDDTVKPVIKSLGVSGNCIKFLISDSKSGIESFKATLNGEWILMNYDHKRNLLWSERYDKTVPLKGAFKLEVKDQAGNISTYSTNIP